MPRAGGSWCGVLAAPVQDGARRGEDLCPGRQRKVEEGPEEGEGASHFRETQREAAATGAGAMGV